MDYGIQNRVIGYDDSKFPVKRIRKFLAPDGREYDGGIEEYRAKMANELGGAGQTDRVPEGAGEAEKVKE